jgi:hypothetical protein
MSIDELRAWQAFDSVDPIGAYRADLHAALIAQQVAGRPGSKLADYIVVDPRPQTEEQREAAERARKAAQVQANFDSLKNMLEDKAKPITK